MTFMSRQILTADALNGLATAISQLQAVAPFKPVGTWDASAGTFPVGAVKGDTYIVSVAGTVDSQMFTANDELVAIIDAPSPTTFAGNWLKIQGSITRAEIEAALGAALVGSAFRDTTDAGNIQAGTLDPARLPAIPMSDVTGLAAALNALAPLASPVFTGSPTAPTPAPGDNDTSIATTAFVAAAVAAASAVSSVFGRVGAVQANAGDYALTQIYNSPITPQGRLTLATGVPVMTSSVSGATSVLYTPFVGQIVPIWDGMRWVATDIGGELSQALSDATKSPAAAVANTCYDYFLWNDAGTVRCTRGPAWSSDTARGAGAGTSELQRTNGLRTNKNAITNGPAAGCGTYVGTIRTNGSALVDFILGGTGSGGVAGFIGVWNAFNRRMAVATVVDNGSSYTYSSSTIRAARASNNNRVSFVSGSSDDAILANYSFWVLTAIVEAAKAQAGVAFDSTSVVNAYAVVTMPPTTGATYGYYGSQSVNHCVSPQSGFHFIQAVEIGDGTNANTFDDTSGNTLRVYLSY